MIGSTLAALVAQRDIDDSVLAPESFDVFVFANNCSDGTAEVVRAFARRHPAYAIFVAEAWLEPEAANIGTARGVAMDAAAARLADRSGAAVIASTDADSLPAPTWLAWTQREMRGADAVMGRILFDPAEWDALPEHTRRMLRAENAYQFAVTHLVSLLDPKPYDPWPRHWQRWAPSFAVRVDAYTATGGVPRIRVLEDIALYEALERNGARIRHSLRVRMTTSARLNPRVNGGFGTRIAEWNALEAATGELWVEHPEDTLDRLTRTVATDRPTRGCVRAVDATLALREICASRSSRDIQGV